MAFLNVMSSADLIQRGFQWLRAVVAAAFMAVGVELLLLARRSK
jgi:hypothetical protein